MGDHASCSSSQPHPASGSPQWIDKGNIELVSVIGTGAYGMVYLAVDYLPQQPVYRAVKALRRYGLDERQRHFQRREIALHRLASSHPSIVTMDRLIEEGDHLYVVMDYGEEGDLFAMITDRQRYVGDDELIRDVFLQLLDGIDHLHQLGISHRDVKPENIVCSDDGKRVGLCDFGLATSEVSCSEFGCGSTFYIAPECLGEWFPGNTHYPTRTGDVWSLGIILVNLVCGRNPWRIASPHDESFNAFLNDPDFLRRILPISRQCLDILTQIFTVDPAERITITQLRQLILEIDSFSMDEEELRATHLAAQQASSSPVRVIPPKYYPSSPASPYGTDSWQGSNFDQETPSLRTDSGSPSPPIRRSASSSSSAAASSLPPTPLLSADEAGPIPPTSSQVWEALKHQTHESRRRSVPTIPSVELRIEPSPDVMSDGRNPFFR